MKICLNCKYCSYNVLMKKRNKFWKLIDRIFGNPLLEVEKQWPTCTNEKVYFISEIKGKNISLFCDTARYSFPIPDFYLCGKEAKYFEEDK